MVDNELGLSIRGAQSGVYMPQNDMFHKHYKINLNGDTSFMDWQDDTSSGYVFQVHIDDAINTVDDDIKLQAEMTIPYYYYDNGGYHWGTAWTDPVVLQVDLASYK